MAARPTARDHHRPDLVHLPVQERIADLWAVARSTRSTPGTGRERRVLGGLRDALGRRLIAAGTALVGDESLRRRPAVRS
jgi:hypothetical protein